MNTDRIKRRVPHLAMSLLGLAAALLALTGPTEAALAALALAVALIPWLLLDLARTIGGVRDSVGQAQAGLRRANVRLARLDTRVKKQSQVVRKLDRGLGKVTEHTSAIKYLDVRPGVQEANKRLGEVRQRLVKLGYAVEATASEAVNLGRLQDQVLEGQGTMPSLGGWAATNRTITELVEKVLAAPVDPHVLECGSGASTVWTAAALRTRGGGRVTTLEHDSHYAEQTRQELARRDLAAYATVLTAPLADLPGADGRPWYDTSAIPAPDAIDILFVDGPPGSTTELARQPAWPHFSAAMKVGGWVILDDTDRPGEQEIVEDWTSHTVSGKRLTVVGHLGRATLLQVTAG